MNVQKQCQWKGGPWSKDLIQNQRILTESHNQDQYSCEGLWVFLLCSSKNELHPAMNSSVSAYKHFQR